MTFELTFIMTVQTGADNGEFIKFSQLCSHGCGKFMFVLMLWIDLSSDLSVFHPLVLSDGFRIIRRARFFQSSAFCCNNSLYHVRIEIRTNFCFTWTFNIFSVTLIDLIIGAS